MKHNKETTPITEKEREDFWLETVRLFPLNYNKDQNTLSR